MASKIPPTTPRHKSLARTASLDFGGKAPPTPKYVESTHKSIPERRSSRPPHSEKRTPAGRGAEGQDDHSKVKEQLAMIERSKSNLMQDLARAKRNVDDLTTKLNGVNGACKNEKVHSLEKGTSVFLEKEGWQVELDAMKQQYELALLELQTSTQAMESLKHELMVCVEAKDEAVRLAGEAMSAAESTARRVEQLSAELFTTKGSAVVGDTSTAGMDDLIDEFSGAMETSLLEFEVPLKLTAQEETLLPTVEESNKRCVAVSLNAEVAEAKVEDQRMGSLQSKDQEPNGDVLTSSLEALQGELAAAKEAEQRATDKLLVIEADMERARLEAEKSMTAESIAQASLAEACRKLEEAEEKLAKASVEDAALVATLGSLKTELEKTRNEAMEASDRETTARNKTRDLLDSMEEMRESNQAELLTWKGKETSARAMVESLQEDLQRQKSESASAAEKEAIAAAKITDMIKELGRSRSQLIEQQKHSSCDIVALSTKLEANQAKLVAYEERESSSATRIATLTFDLEKKQAEVDDLQRRFSEVETKAEAASTELASLREDNLQISELKVKEQEASAQINALNAEVLGLKQALEEALNAGGAAREEVSKLEATLQNARSEGDKATCEVQAAYHQIELSKRMAADSLAEATAAKDAAEKALDAVHAASNAAVEEALLASKLAEEKAELAREEAYAAENKLQVALKDVEMATMEVEKIKKEAQSARENADSQKAALAVEKERVKAMEDEFKEVLGEVQKLRTELSKLQADATDAVAARNNVECMLQDAMEQLEAHKLREKEEGPVNHEAQEEVASLKEKLRACEEQLKIMTSEVEALQSSRGELMRELETAKVEKEASKRAVVDAHQHLSDMEKAKRVMEADIQRLLDDSKLWKTPKDTRDILALSEINGINGYVLVADSRDEKPQPDSPDRESLQSLDVTYLHINGKKRGGELVVEKEEDNEAPMDDTPMRVGKKKKHALLHRLHSYLDKKKTPNAL